MLPRLLARSWPGLLLQVPSFSSLLKGVYNPKAFVPHAALLRQAFAHCAIFPTAASRRSLGRVSVPVWLVVLSDQLWIVALVGRYPTNKLIQRRFLRQREVIAPQPKPQRSDPPLSSQVHDPGSHAVLARVSPSYSPLPGRCLRVTHPSATLLSPEGPFSFDLHV